MPSRVPLQVSLETRRTIAPETGCWLWTGFLESNGYGVLRYERVKIYVHRAAMNVYKGFDLKSPALICHIRACPNKHCFNPEHLYVGDHSSNLWDAYTVGKNKPWGRIEKLR